MAEDRLELSRADCEAVMSYIWERSRSAPNGRAFKAWERMFKFIGGEVEKEVVEMPLFDEVGDKSEVK